MTTAVKPTVDPVNSRQAAIITAYTGSILCDMESLLAYLTEITEQQVSPVHLGTAGFMEKCRTLAYKDFIALFDTENPDAADDAALDLRSGAKRRVTPGEHQVTIQFATDGTSVGECSCGEWEGADPDPDAVNTIGVQHMIAELGEVEIEMSVVLSAHRQGS
jgi:hypothetical protein